MGAVRMIREFYYQRGWRFGTRYVWRYGADAARSCVATFTDDNIIPPAFCAGMCDAVLDAVQEASLP